MTKELIKPIAPPDFVKELVEAITAEAEKVDSTSKLVITHPNYDQPVGVQGNYARTAIYSGAHTGMVTRNCVYLSHICGEFISVIFDDVRGKSFVRSYCPNFEMDVRQGNADSGQNRAGVILLSALSKLPEHVAQFIMNDVEPS